MAHASGHIPADNGFALVATLLMMVMLVLISVSVLSLSSVSLRFTG